MTTLPNNLYLRVMAYVQSNTNQLMKEAIRSKCRFGKWNLRNTFRCRIEQLGFVWEENRDWLESIGYNIFLMEVITYGIYLPQSFIINIVYNYKLAKLNNELENQILTLECEHEDLRKSLRREQKIQLRIFKQTQRIWHTNIVKHIQDEDQITSDNFQEIEKINYDLENHHRDSRRIFEYRQLDQYYELEREQDNEYYKRVMELRKNHSIEAQKICNEGIEQEKKQKEYEDELKYKKTIKYLKETGYFGNDIL
jgi:hypothetical protein